MGRGCIDLRMETHTPGPLSWERVTVGINFNPNPTNPNITNLNPYLPTLTLTITPTKHEGYGVYKSIYGDVYEGQYRNDRRHGKGK
jgi:hypothetical protein